MVTAVLWVAREQNVYDTARRELSIRLESSSAGWAEATDQFFATAETAAGLVDSLSTVMADEPDRVALLAGVIAASSSIDSAFVGHDNGDFEFVARSGDVAPDGFRVRLISNEPSRRFKGWFSDADLNRRRAHDAADDGYDPRKRPWFRDIGEPSEWTAPYTFSSSGALGITYSARSDDAGMVVGVDVKLAEINGFLQRLAPGERGKAVVLAVEESPTNVSAPVFRVVATSSEDYASLPDWASVEADFAHGSPIENVLARLENQSLQRDHQSRFDDVIVERSTDGERTLVVRPARSDRNWYLIAQAEDGDALSGFNPGSGIMGAVPTGLAVASLVGLLGSALNRYRLKLKHEAERDELTGLFSRRAFQRELEKRLQKKQAVTLAILDLDRFKSVNDTYGHLVGDTVLREATLRVRKEAAGAGALAARLGGDEFAVVSATNMDWALLVRSLSDPVVVDGIKCEVGTSIGVANSVDGIEPTELIRSADRALFAVKAGGGGGYCLNGAPPVFCRDDLVV